MSSGQVVEGLDDRQRVGTGLRDIGGSYPLLRGLALRGSLNRLGAPRFIALGEALPRDIRYAWRLIAVLTLSAACCVSLVGSVIWIVTSLCPDAY
jgi:hypothetical protein